MPDLIVAPPPPGINPNVTVSTQIIGVTTIGAGETRYSVSIIRMFENLWGDVGDFTNDGLLWLDASNGGNLVAVRNWNVIANRGTAVAHTVNGGATTFQIAAHLANPLMNSGSIYALSDIGNAQAIETWADVLIVNDGTIAARGGNSGSAIYAPNGAPIYNTGYGAILAEGANAIAITLFGAHHNTPLAQFWPDVLNYGRIEAHATNPDNASIAIYVGGGHTIENYGTIRADVAIYADPNWYSTPQHLSEHVTNFAAGTIDGAIYLGLGDDVLVNQGTINGDVDLGDDNDRFDNSLGHHNGATELGWGDDTYLGGNGTDAVAANRGDDNLAGGAGDDLLLGGWGHDVLAGDAGNDGLYGEGGYDTITTQGGDYVDAGDGDDRVVLADYTFAKVLGGSGRDVLVLPTDSRILSLSLVASSGRVSGFEEINVAAGDHIVVRAADVAALAAGTTLTISGQGNGIVDLAGSWSLGPVTAAGGVGYVNYTSGSAQLLVAQTLQVNLGANASGGVGLDAVAGGVAAPTPGSIPGVDLTSNQVQLASAVPILTDFEVYASEHWISTAGVISLDVEVRTFINSGTLEGVNQNGGAAGGLGGYGALVLNYGTITATALSGIANLNANKTYFENYGVFNSNNLVGNAVGVSVSAEHFENLGVVRAQTSQTYAYGYLSWGSSPVVNQGSIEGISSEFVAFGAFAHNGGQFTNTGAITASAGWRAYGFVSSTHVLDLVNSGSITAQTTKAGGQSVAITLYYASDVQHIRNSGTITGETAIQTDYTVNGNSVWLNNSGQINGRIVFDGPHNGARDDLILNSGTIKGAVTLGLGRDVYDGRSGIQTGIVSGQGGNDLLIGAKASLDGGDGNDVLVSNGGATLTGGAGADSFVFMGVVPGSLDTITDFVSGTDRIDLRALAPTSVNVSGSTITAATASGTLTIHLGSGAATLADIIWSSGATVTGTAGDDVLVGGPSASTLAGGDGMDILLGGAGNDLLDGGTGGETFETHPGAADIMAGGGGNDLYIINAANDLVIESANGGIDTVMAAEGSRFSFELPDYVENFIGTSVTGNMLDNELTGSNDANLIVGGAGNDLIRGLGASDSLQGGSGADRFSYTSVADSTVNSYDEILDFEHGVDTIDLGSITPNSISLNLDYDHSWGTHIATDVRIGTPDGILKIQVDGYVDHSDFLGRFASIDGTSGNDRLTLAPGSYWLEGLAGNDLLIGSSSSDTLHGGDGDDTLVGGLGSDALIGGAGADRFFVGNVDGYVDRIADYATEDRIYIDASLFAGLGLGSLQPSQFALSGKETFDTRIIYAPERGWIRYDADGLGPGGFVSIASVQPYADISALSFYVYSGDPLTVQSSLSYSLSATDWNLQLTGTSAINGFGNAADNDITGNDAANSLLGFGGNDVLHGAGGNDYLDGGSGADTLDGGTGNDRIVYDAADNPANVTGGIGTDTLVVIDQAAPIGHDLVAGSFESAQVIQHDTGSNSWSSVVTNYSASWQALNQDMVNDDGSHSFTAFDFDSSQAWDQVWFTYNAAGQQISEDYRYDDGKRSWVAIDAAGTQSWSQVWFTYNSAGQQISEDYRYDDGKRSWVSIDAANASNWAQVWFTYDVSGNKVSEDYRYDDNSRSWVAFDADNSKVWNNIWFTFDANGHQTSEDRTNDNGTRVWTAYDANSNLAWSSDAYYYDNTGHLYQSIRTWDDGHTTTTLF